MTLRIIRAAEPIPVHRLIAAIYGPPGLGKSTLAYTAHKPILLDFDRGAHRAAHRKDTVPVDSWDDVADMSESDFAPYGTVIVDTAGRALDHLTADIIKRNAKYGGRGGVLSLQGYGALKGEFVSWLKQLTSYGKDVVLIAHMDEQRKGDDVIERLDVQGGSKGEVYKVVDAMGRLSIVNGQRMLNFNPTDAAFGKNPGQLAPVAVPHPDQEPHFLANIMQSIKDRLNALTAEQAAAQIEAEQWRNRIGELQSLEAFNRAIPEVRKQPKAIKALFEQAAVDQGYVFDATTRAFIVPVGATEAANEQTADAAAE